MPTKAPHTKGEGRPAFGPNEMTVAEVAQIPEVLLQTPDFSPVHTTKISIIHAVPVTPPQQSATSVHDRRSGI